MKNCLGCKYAKWDRTAGGKLHPSGTGRCQYQWKMTPLPASMYFPFISIKLVPSGGHISRRQELKEHCTYYLREVK